VQFNDFAEMHILKALSIFSELGAEVFKLDYFG